MLIVHSRGGYNVKDMILVAQPSFIVSLLCILFQKFVSDVGHFFKPYCTSDEIAIKQALNANECVR